MKKSTQKAFLVFSLFSVFITLLPFARASATLSSYEARFEVIADANNKFGDVLVELKLAYGDDGVSQTKDMKIIEAAVVKDVAVTDGKGKKLGFTVKPGEKESAIIWDLTSVQEGNQAVIIRFKLPGAVTTKEGRNIFGAYWVGGFIVPVEKALYRFIFPPGYSFKECSVYPQYGYEEKIVDGKKEVSVAIAPLKGESFALAFTPDFGEWKGIVKQAETIPLESDLGKKDVQEEPAFPTRKPTALEEEVSERRKPQGLVEEKRPVEEDVEKVQEAVQRGTREVSEEPVQEVDAEKGKAEERIENVKITKEEIQSPAKTNTGKDGERSREVQPVDTDAKRVYDSARELFLQGKYRKALATLRYFIDTYPQSEQVDAASYLIGECHGVMACMS